MNEVSLVIGQQNISISSRLYKTEDDLVQMQAMLMKERAQTDDWRYPHVGDLKFWFFIVACHLEPREHIHLWHSRDQLIGYAVLGEDPSFDCQVLPGYTWRGIEDEALAWAGRRIAELCRIDSQRWGGALVSDSRQDDAERIEFLERYGFRPGGQFLEVNMLLTLEEPVPEPVVPAGYQVRSMGRWVSFPTVQEHSGRRGCRGQMARSAMRIMLIL